MGSLEVSSKRSFKGIYTFALRDPVKGSVGFV